MVTVVESFKRSTLTESEYCATGSMPLPIAALRTPTLTLTLFRSIRVGGQIDWKSGYSIYNLGDDIRDRTSANTPSRRSILRDSLPPAERMRFFGPFFTEGKTSASRPS